jgi:(1->4)-alpha-D-glucan 1-alpha-D-glucosylmutase
MHVQAGDDAQVQRALCEHERATWRESLPPAVVVRESALPARLVVRFSEEWDAYELTWCLLEENGEKRRVAFVLRTLPEVERREVENQRFVARRLTLDAKPAPGYHRLLLLRSQQVVAETLLIVAPDSCYQPEAVREDGRTWGPAAQLYTLRSERNWGIGDLTDLRLLLEQWAQHGADIVGLNPLHALFLHNPESASPYSPSSRLFLNSLYLDPERIDDFRECEEARDLVYSSEFLGRLRDGGRRDG